MTVRTALVTDSTSNLYPELAAERHIYMAPLYVIWGEEAYKDGVDITDAELFERLSASDEIPKTSQVSPQDFVTLFEQAREAENADEIVCAVISSELSGTYASAIQAKEIVNFPVHVIDTRQTSWALGFSMLAAAEARDNGASPAEIVEIIRSVSTHTLLTFTIESLEYLHRGGRIGNASRLLGSALNIKPVLDVTDGLVNTVDKVRTRKRALTHLLKVAADRAAGHSVVRLAVIHGGCPDEGQFVLDQGIEQLQPRENYLSYVTAVLGVHTGPGAVGVIVEWSA
ncbi:MAG: DegV family protein [Anaerolineae bacterium]|nr:DegV family protein [Anaerolineae bacterium]